MSAQPPLPAPAPQPALPGPLPTAESALQADDPDAPLRMLFSLQGRISRTRFWMWGVGALFGAGLVLHVLLGVARVKPSMADHIVDLLLLWPAVAISAKRWHDRDRSAWWVLIALVPVVGWAWMLVANGFLPGTQGANRYGPAPRA